MNKQITITIANTGTAIIPKGTTLLELSASYANTKQWPILVATVDNELQDLSRKLLFDSTVEFLDASDPNGFRAYQRSVSFLMVYAAKVVLGKKARVVIGHSINKNYYCELPEHHEPISQELLEKIEAVMRETVERNLPIEKHTLQKEYALNLAAEFGLYDKQRLLKYRHNLTVSFYKLDWFYNYFYGEMAPSTGCLNHFKLVKRSRGFMLQFPDASQGNELAELAPRHKVSEVFEEASEWARIINADTVGALNDKLCQHGNGMIIRVAEALHEKKTALLADRIVNENRPIVLIAGPTSSGKTTFAARLSTQLRAAGVTPHVIGLDNYYHNRGDGRIPRDEHGNEDYETIVAIDTAQITKDLQALLGGERVEIPTFNFLTGKREYKGRFLELAKGDVLILEGIHGLNEQISEGIPSAHKFKIFISALTQINIDDHNRIPTTDTRLVRRIVRDFQSRGTLAVDTIDRWPSVLRGEAKYIYPHQEEADAFFNSALIYEMCVLKQYAEPLLFDITPDMPQYTEARRLVKFLSSFLCMPSENIPVNSILREFVGGSCYSH
ncbi:MAG: nucleoside kinase [Defluviitaleaceae bacterium]|nr:nucleoside kinase [Defluviitaleaceae bacterium]